jgi:DNA-binding MarR family transcriptional regulator
MASERYGSEKFGSEKAISLRAAVRTLALTGRRLEKAAAPLTLPQYRVLALVASAPERASALAERADVTKATLTGVIDSLVQRHWVKRADVAGDRRGVSLALTPAGKAVLDDAEVAMVQWLALVLEPAGLDAAEQVYAGLAALGDALAASRRAVAP